MCAQTISRLCVAKENIYICLTHACTHVNSIKVCIQVAQHRNICQACLNDMQYGLPVGVRDKLLKEGKLTSQMMVYITIFKK